MLRHIHSYTPQIHFKARAAVTLQGAIQEALLTKKKKKLALMHTHVHTHKESTVLENYVELGSERTAPLCYRGRVSSGPECGALQGSESHFPPQKQ